MIKNEPYIIAEIGVNWESDIDTAMRMMNDARDKGADAAKFQCFSKEEVDNPQLLKYSPDLNEILRLKEYAHIMKLEFLCTPMYPEAVELLQPHVDRWKIRESDFIQSDVTRRVYHSINRKHTIFSTQDKDIIKANRWFRPIYCVPEYPTDPEDIDYQLMRKADGFSCHCPDMDIWPKVADTDPEIVEIHVTPERDGTHPDDPVSYEFDQFGEIVDILKHE